MFLSSENCYHHQELHKSSKLYLARDLVTAAGTDATIIHAINTIDGQFCAKTCDNVFYGAYRCFSYYFYRLIDRFSVQNIYYTNSTSLLGVRSCICMGATRGAACRVIHGLLSSRLLMLYAEPTARAGGRIPTVARASNPCCQMRFNVRRDDHVCAWNVPHDD